MGGFPRIRGDVPFNSDFRLTQLKFSPHTRGCSLDIWLRVRVSMVFPAYAGMFLRQETFEFPNPGFPRIRGDVPIAKGGRDVGGFVFPAYAGMFPPRDLRDTGLDCFPRIRGDVPVIPATYRDRPRFSPHTRGCSVGIFGGVAKRSVFPAYAGMFLSLENRVMVDCGFPRIRGDVP